MFVDFVAIIKPIHYSAFIRYPHQESNDVEWNFSLDQYYQSRQPAGLSSNFQTPVNNKGLT